MSDTPRTGKNRVRFSTLCHPEDAWWVHETVSAQLERELNAANSKIEALNRGNANAERILCELTGCESGRDLPDWIVKKNWELTDLAKAYLELVHNHTLANEHIKRLEEAGDAMAKDFSHFWTDRNSVRDWPKAKEAKP